MNHSLVVADSSEIRTLCFDVRYVDDCRDALASLPVDWQAVDVLINNAGLALGGLHGVFEGKIEDWNTVIDTNIKGVLHLTRLLSEGMKERRSGHIINVGSIASHEVYPGGGVYCATKHAVDAISKATRTDLLDYNVRVTQVSPGAVKTGFSLVRYNGDKERAEKVYQGYQPLKSEDVANVIDFAISQPEHVCLNEIIMTCTAQFNGRIVRQ